MSPLKIEVPNPCMESWQKMLPTQHGKQCSNCATEVIDFTKFSNEQLKDWFSKGINERVCGNFTKLQLNDFNRKTIFNGSWNTVSAKILLASCLTLFINTKSSASEKIQQQGIVQQQDGFSANVSILKVKNAAQDSLITIKGTVKDADDNLPLYGVWVGLKNGKQTTVTDINGNFLIQIPLAKKVDLIFKYMGYNHQKQRIQLKKRTSVVILMKASDIVLGEVVVTKPSFFKRLGSQLKKMLSKTV